MKWLVNIGLAYQIRRTHSIQQYGNYPVVKVSLLEDIKGLQDNAETWTRSDSPEL